MDAGRAARDRSEVDDEVAHRAEAAPPIRIVGEVRGKEAYKLSVLS